LAVFPLRAGDFTRGRVEIGDSGSSGAAKRICEADFKREISGSGDSSMSSPNGSQDEKTKRKNFEKGNFQEGVGGVLKL